MKSILHTLLMSAAMVVFCRGEETTTLAAAGKIMALGSDKPHTITAEVKAAGGATSVTYVVSENCKFMTAGIGVFDDLKKGDNVQIEYREKDDGKKEATQISVQAAATTPAAPPKKPAPKKAPAKKKK